MSAEIPLALIGIGCKFPGNSDSKDLYYEFLRNKGDGMVQPPPDRWDHANWHGTKSEPGKLASTMGGFVSDIDLFDPLEFGISQKEAQYLDPSLRLTLEAAHQALIDSGVDYRGSNTGVYLGQLLTSTNELADDRYEIDNFNGAGKCIAIRANRISFTFDLKGPSFVLDTACSASGYAMHMAASAIRLGEIDQALVLGASTMVNPIHTLSFSKLGVLSPTGSSKSFDAAADGYARAEGFAAVLIKRLDLALNDGDHIYSVITGSAINANGKGKSLTMPEGEAQGMTVRGAYARAKRNPADAFYVELHATGTLVGDPIEVNGAGKVFSKGRDPKKTLRVGSVKANIGHAEGCSFMASLIKVSLMLHNKEIIPNIRFNNPNPKIDFVGGMMKVQTELEKITPNMAASDGKFVASVSTYGVGGANAHVVVESFETVEQVQAAAAIIREPKTATTPLYLFAIGTLTEGSLGRWQTTLTSHFEKLAEPRALRSLSRELTRQARASPYRSFAVGPALAPNLKWSKTTLVSAKPKLCLVFAGQGPQHVFMGRQLSEAYPAFLDAIRANDEILVNKYGQPSFVERSGLFIPGKQATLAANGVWPVADVVISLVFIQIALTDLLKSIGIKYDCVIGHSIGEIAMGYASGHYDRETAVGIAVGRAAAMTQAEGNGGMVALGVGVQKAKLMIKKVLARAGVDSGLWIAGINSPRAVTVAGQIELIDLMVEVAADPADKIFAAKLRVTCAFHTPLMEAQEKVFKDFVKGALTATREPVAKVMSTVDGKWLERDMDVQYCWDNIRQPVLFGTALNKIVQELGADNVSFLEIAPHPVLKSYIEEIGGNPVSLIRRPNPKVPAQNTGEHFQFLEGIGNLLMTGYSYIDANKLACRSDGIVDFVKVPLPSYPYSKSSCWVEDGATRSLRLRATPRPLAQAHFRINVDTHSDLTGHVVMGAVLYPGAGYTEAILENGAFVVENMKVLKPFVLNGHDTVPGHAGVVINGDHWEFRGSTDSKYVDGRPVLETVYASGYFKRENPDYDPENLPTLDVQSLLASSLVSMTGDEFYENLPSSYNYQDHFRNYTKELHAVPYPGCWTGKAYIARFEIPEGTPDVYGKGYCIHPGILDSITQIGLCSFMNMTNKTFDFNGTFLPVSMKKLTRWDSPDSASMEEHLKKGIYVLYKPKAWGAKGPFVSDYVIADSTGRVFFTIDEFEIALAPEPEPVPITDYSMQQRIVTTWQPKAFITPDYTFPPVGGHGGHSYLAEVLETLLTNARTKTNRFVSRVLDLDSSSSIAQAVDAKLSSLLATYRFAVDYFAAGVDAEAADAKVNALKYPHGRSTIVDTATFADQSVSIRDATVDVILVNLDISKTPTNFDLFPRLLAPHGAVIFLLHSGSPSKEEGFVSLSSQGFVSKLQADLGCDVVIQDLPAGQSVILARNFTPPSVLPEELTTKVVFHHFLHGNEGMLVEKVKQMSADGELWVMGNDDAGGIGALGVVAGLISEETQFTVHSVLFEDSSLTVDEREGWVHTIRQNPKILEDHLKVTAAGEVLVRRAVQGSPSTRNVEIHHFGYSKNSHGHRSVAAAYPPLPGPNEVEVAVEAFGITDLEDDAPLTAFVGSVDGKKILGYSHQKLVDAVVVDRRAITSLPETVSVTDAVLLPDTMLPAWVGLVEVGRIEKDSIVLVHDALSRVGRAAIQIVQNLRAPAFFTVASKSEIQILSTEFGIDVKSIAVNASVSTALAAAKEWLEASGVEGFDLIFNSTGRVDLAVVVDIISSFGLYIHNKQTSDPVKLPADAPAARIVDIATLAKKHPAKLTAFLDAVLNAHVENPFKLSPVTISFSDLVRPVENITSSQVLVVKTTRPENVRVDPAAQLFDPRKTYLLIGGCSEFGIGITVWMFNHGARHIYLTSRRGRKALSPVDKLYLRDINNKGGDAQAISCDALSKADMAKLIQTAEAVGPLGGIMLMTVVLRDSSFANLTQQHFDDVYQSKVAALNVILELVDLSKIDFNLLFSTIGTVFGNAGQAPYLVAQLYLDKIAETLPNTISMSFPPITDSGIFKRLVQSTKGGANTAKLSKLGMTTPQVCEFIGDSIVRKIPHYLPLLNHKACGEVFETCDPLLFGHLLPPRLLAVDGASKEDGGESPASLLSNLLGLGVEQISDNALITSYGLDSLAATRFSSQLKGAFGISVSQIELLGSMSVGVLNELIAKSRATESESGSSTALDDGSSKYGQPLVPILNDRLVYDEPYTTDASPHQYRIWLAQLEYDNSRRRNVAVVDQAMKRFGATQWDTHEGYFITVESKVPIDLDRMTKAFEETVNRHGSFRTTFHWDERKGKLMQTIHPSANVHNASVIDFSNEPDAYKKAYDMSLANNMNPNFSLDKLPLISSAMFNLGGGAYAFNITVHHIMTDETSLGIFFYDLFQLYIHGIDSLPPVQLHYSDFSDWLIRTADRRAELRDEQIKYWTKKLDGVQPLILTLAKPSEVEQSPITQIEGRIGLSALKRYNDYVATTSATSFAAFFAAYNLLLYKYSSQNSFVVGTAVTQRSMAQLQEVVGFFANMLPIRTTLEDETTFAEYLEKFRLDLVADLSNDDVTLEDIVSQTKTSSQDRSYFKHLFAPGGLNMSITGRLDTSDITTTAVISLPNGEEKYEFLLTVHYKTGEVILRFDNYLYTEETARQFLDAYCNLVDTLGRDPYVKIGDVSAVSDHEHARLVKELSTSGPINPVERKLHQLVEAQAKQTPTTVAIEFEDQYLTYAQLNSKANRLARLLSQQGVGPDSVVAICFERGIPQVLAILAILKAGGAFMPLDPDDPTLRKEMLIVDTNAKILLTTYSKRRDFDKALASKVIVAYIDDATFEKRLQKLDDSNFEVPGHTSANLAYVMFTSGSTGKPKGVMIEHRSISNLVQNSQPYGYHRGARVLSSLAYTFDPFVVDVFGTLSCGATLVTGRKELVLGDIGRAVQKLRINVVHCTPSILAVVPVEHYPTLETVVVAGEALGKKLIEDWSKRVKFMNMYGPTEASVDCIHAHVTDASLTGVIGRPLPNNRLYILDENMRPTPIGVEGELFIGGVQLARGYLNQPEQTEKAFVPNPFVSGERLYRTGDVAMFRADGNIVYCGRKDSQIKLRGQRIELGEIEDVVNKYHSVQRAAVLIRNFHDAPAVVAFVEFKSSVAEDHIADEKETLKMYISERLPRFMYPSLIAHLPTLPTSTSGKVNRRALMELDLAPFHDTNPDVGLPQSDVEVALHKIFSDVLKTDPRQLGVTHDLFSVGLNSLLAVQAAVSVGESFKLNIGLNNIYLRPTIRELSNVIIDAMGQDQRQIMAAEDSEDDFLIEFLPVKKKGTHPRMFIVHDITGMATPFMRLGAYMPNEMWAIGDKHFGSVDGFTTIEEMADHYIALIRSVQPHGPYVIAGYSMGGLVALVIADKLKKAGEVITHLIIFDTIFIPARERQSLKSSDWTARAIDRISQNFPEIGERWKTKLSAEIRKNLDAMWELDPPYYDGPTTLVVPKDRVWYRSGHASDFDTGLDDLNGWEHRISDLTMKISPGRHDTMFTPAHVKGLAQVLKGIFAEFPTAQSSQ